MADERIRRAQRAGDEEREEVEQARAGNVLVRGLAAEDLDELDAEAERRSRPGARVTRSDVIRERLRAGRPGGDWPAYCRAAELLERELEALALPREEASLLADVLNGCGMTMLTSPDACTPQALRLEVSDAIALNAVHDKWGVTAAAILGRLRELTPEQARAIYAGAARFWALTDLPTDLALRASGLWRGPVAPPAPPKRAPKRKR